MYEKDSGISTFFLAAKTKIFFLNQSLSDNLIIDFDYDLM